MSEFYHNEKNKSNTFTKIPDLILFDKKLNINSKHLLSLIIRLSMNFKDYCYVDNDYFAKRLEVKPFYISRLISNLKGLNYISIEYEKKFKDKKRIIQSLINYDLSKNFTPLPDDFEKIKELNLMEKYFYQYIIRFSYNKKFEDYNENLAKKFRVSISTIKRIVSKLKQLKYMNSESIYTNGLKEKRFLIPIKQDISSSLHKMTLSVEPLFIGIEQKSENVKPIKQDISSSLHKMTLRQNAIDKPISENESSIDAGVSEFAQNDPLVNIKKTPSNDSIDNIVDSVSEFAQNDPLSYKQLINNNKQEDIYINNNVNQKNEKLQKANNSALSFLENNNENEEKKEELMKNESVKPISPVVTKDDVPSPGTIKSKIVPSQGTLQRNTKEININKKDLKNDININPYLEKAKKAAFSFLENENENIDNQKNNEIIIPKSFDFYFKKLKKIHQNENIEKMIFDDKKQTTKLYELCNLFTDKDSKQNKINFNIFIEAAYKNKKEWYEKHGFLPALLWNCKEKIMLDYEKIQKEIRRNQYDYPFLTFVQLYENYIDDDEIKKIIEEEQNFKLKLKEEMEKSKEESLEIEPELLFYEFSELGYGKSQFGTYHNTRSYHDKLKEEQNIKRANEIF